VTVDIKPIETRYNGYRFRSRLEARWAVFFDEVGIEYEYEKEGYDLGTVGYYLPDFYLHVLRRHIEIKPRSPLKKDEYAKLKKFSEMVYSEICLRGEHEKEFDTFNVLSGEPYLNRYTVYDVFLKPNRNTKWGKCPNCGRYDLLDDVGEIFGEWVLDQDAIDPDLYGTIDQNDYSSRQIACEHCFRYNGYFNKLHCYDVKRMKGNYHPFVGENGVYSCAGVVIPKRGYDPFNQKILSDAYSMAVSARFEHGETPQNRERLYGR
jgi:hypothetical protein